MKTVLNVKVDKDIKDRAQRMTTEMGIPLSLVVNSMLRDFIIAKEFTFKYEPKLKTEVVREISDAVTEYRKEPKKHTGAKSVNDLRKQLDV